jgi:hypothetical protein
MIGCMLHNTATDRYHPIFFRMAPMPGNADAGLPAQRYKSAMHHTTGFDTPDEAVASGQTMCQQNSFVWDGRCYDWNGDGIPAVVDFFTI